MVFGLGFTASLVVAAIALPVLVYGAEVAVDRMVAIAEYYGIPGVIIGLTVVSIGTSLPELAAHVTASAGILTGGLDYEIASATVLGTNIGSDIVQQTLIVGIIALMAGGLSCGKKALERDYLPMIGTAVVVLVLAWDGVLSRVDGVVLILSYMGYLYYIYLARGLPGEQSTHASTDVRRDTVIVAAAMLAVIGSAQVLLSVIEQVVLVTGLGGSLIGVVTLGIAAAFPELFTAVAGIRKGAADISFGTLIGSNITNPLLAIGIGAVMSTYWVPRPVVLWDLPLKIVTAIVIVPFLYRNRRIGRRTAVYLVAVYFGYLAVRFLLFPAD